MGGAERLSYSVAVRALCEFTAKTGDLDLRFTPSPTALEGIVGHRTVASRRSEQYQSEVALQGEFGELKVKGRADGYDPAQNAWKKSKPIAATSASNRPITASCTGRRRKSTAG